MDEGRNSETAGPCDRRTLLGGLLFGSLYWVAGGLVRPASAAGEAAMHQTPSGRLSGFYARAGAGADIVFLSGAAALDLYHRHPHTPLDEILPDDIVAQTHMTMRNLYEVLRVAGLGWENVASILRYQRDIAHSAAIEAAMAPWFDSHRPAATAVGVRRLSAPSSLLEIELIAVAPRDGAMVRNSQGQGETAMSGLDVIHSRPALADSMIFAPGIRVDAGRALVFLSGITAAPLEGAGPDFDMPEDFDAQVRLATANIDRILADLGVGKDRIVRIVNFYTETFDGREMGRWLAGWRPCSSAIGVSALAVPGAKILYDLIIAA